MLRWMRASSHLGPCCLTPPFRRPSNLLARRCRTCMAYESPLSSQSTRVATRETVSPGAIPIICQREFLDFKGRERPIHRLRPAVRCAAGTVLGTRHERLMQSDVASSALDILSLQVMAGHLRHGLATRTPPACAPGLSTTQTRRPFAGPRLQSAFWCMWNLPGVLRMTLLT